MKKNAASPFFPTSSFDSTFNDLSWGDQRADVFDLKVAQQTEAEQFRVIRNNPVLIDDRFQAWERVDQLDPINGFLKRGRDRGDRACARADRQDGDLILSID